jgi:pyruvate formate lyase activating enzyme
MIPEEEVFSYLKERRKMLEGLVITGGEPFLQEDLADFIRRVKKLGYLIKIDTNGMFPDKLEELIEDKLVDYVAMDVKAPRQKYRKLAGVEPDLMKLQRSIDIIKKSSPNYEFRTTFVPGLLKKEDIVEIAKWLKGAESFYLQQFKVNPPLLSPAMEKTLPYSRGYILETLEEIKPFFKECSTRGC